MKEMSKIFEVIEAIAEESNYASFEDLINPAGTDMLVAQFRGKEVEFDLLINIEKEIRNYNKYINSVEYNIEDDTMEIWIMNFIP